MKNKSSKPSFLEKTLRPFLVILCVSPTANAQTDPIDDPTIVESPIKVVELKKGQKAPFTGQLLSNEAAIIVGQKAERCEDLLNIQQSHLLARCTIEKKGFKKQSEIRVRSLKSQLKITNKKLKGLEESLERTFWTDPVVWGVAGVAIGVVAGFGLTLTSAYIVGQVR